eukprot:scaffold193142_cov27-Tisochrysis_lutea.AAC.1
MACKRFYLTQASMPPFLRILAPPVRVTVLFSTLISLVITKSKTGEKRSLPVCIRGAEVTLVERLRARHWLPVDHVKGGAEQMNASRLQRNEG